MSGRFDRQVPMIGEDGQQRIMSSRIGIAGCGGLGVDALTSLVQAGALDFVLCDGGFPEIPGLNTQFIYSPGDMRPKAAIAAEWALALNYSVMAQAHAEPVGPDNVRMFSGSAVVLDCTGDESAGKVLEDWCREEGVPLIRGRCSGYIGSVDVCAGPKRYPVEESTDGAPKLGGIVAAVAGIMASEAVRMIVDPSSGGRRIGIDAVSWTVESDGDAE